jgi:predicted ribosome quality control (RQC) complex YloA/Tae2 family protein
MIFNVMDNLKKIITKLLNEQYEEGIKIDEYPFGDYIVYIGRNSKSNDYLTFNIADQTDLWFHVKNYPGTHVILKLNNNYPNSDIIGFAASLAKKHSKGNNVDNVKVVYTEVSNVYKTEDMKPGQVDVDKSKLSEITI